MKEQTNVQITKYIFNSNIDIKEYTIKKQIILLFLQNKSKVYKKLDDIVMALQRNGCKHAQGSISRSMKEIELAPFDINGKVYTIAKTHIGYALLDQQDSVRNLRYTLETKCAFKHKRVFFENDLDNPQMFIFWIADNEQIMSTAKEQFKRVLGNSLLDAFYIGDKLIILLDYKSDQFHFNCRVLKNFFSKLYDPF